MYTTAAKTNDAPGPPPPVDIVLAADYDALAAELAGEVEACEAWKALCISKDRHIGKLESALDTAYAWIAHKREYTEAERVAWWAQVDKLLAPTITLAPTETKP
jgi:hypothetical protein